MKVTYQGIWNFPGKTLRLFSLHLPSGNFQFAVAPGESLKTKLAECLARFSGSTKQRAA